MQNGHHPFVSAGEVPSEGSDSVSSGLPDMQETQLDQVAAQRDPVARFIAEDKRIRLTEIEKEKTIAKKKGQEEAEKELQAGRSIVLTGASGIRSLTTHWLWKERVPMGEITLIAGRGGVGKSTMLARIAADITTGNMDGSFFGKPKSVLYVVNEDSLERTVKPRMVAAGAELSRIFFVSVPDSNVILPRDCERMAEAARSVDAACVMLDPLSANLESIKGDTGSFMRTSMQAIQKMCIENNLAAIGLAHTRKAMTNNLMDAILGSTEMGNVCRSAMGVIADPEVENGYILSQEKSNLGNLNIDSYTYTIEPFSFTEDGNFISTSFIKITGTTKVKTSDVLAESSLSDGGQMTDAKKFLKDLLESQGKTNAKDAKTAARQEGISESSLHRARKSLDVVVERSGFGRDLVSYWSLPKIETPAVMPPLTGL